MAREIPQYVSQLSLGSMPKVQFSNAQAEATNRMSAQMAAAGQDMEQKAAKIERLTAITTLRENLHRMSDEAGADVGTLRSNIDGFKTGFLKGIKNPELAAEFEAGYGLEALPYIDSATNKYRKNLDDTAKVERGRAFQQNLTTIGKIAPNLFSEIPEEKKAAQEALANIFTQSAQLSTEKDLDGTFSYSPDQQIEMAGRTQAALIETLPPEKQLQVLGNNVAGYEATMQYITKHEIDPRNPDKVHGDGDDTKAYMGVNSGANKEEFAQIEAFLAKGETGKARALVNTIYKEKYWNAIGGDSLPAEVQGIIMDAAVNQGVGFAKQLKEEVAKGATPSQLLEMRRERYAKTKGTPEERKSWERRLSSFEHLALGEDLNLLTPNIRERIKDSAYKAIEADYALKNDDPVKWAQKKGYDLLGAVSVQPDPFYAKVMTKDRAKAEAGNLSKLQTVDDITNYASSLQAEFGPLAQNAIRDLKASGMKSPQEAAIMLSLKNPVAYKQHVELLAEVGVAGDAGVAGVFKERGFDNKTLQSRLTAELEDWSIMRGNEGMNLQEYEENLNVINSLVQAKMIKDGTGDYDSAIKFALEPEVNDYKTASLNGVMYRVPQYDKNGGKYDVEAIEARVSSAYADILPVIAEANKKKGFHLSDDIIPYLNKEGDGLEFMTPIREPIIDGKGNKITLRFDDIIANESREERVNRIREEMYKLPYDQRDAFRAKEFGIQIKKNRNVSP